MSLGTGSFWHCSKDSSDWDQSSASYDRSARLGSTPQGAGMLLGPLKQGHSTTSLGWQTLGWQREGCNEDTGEMKESELIQPPPCEARLHPTRAHSQNPLPSPPSVPSSTAGVPGSVPAPGSRLPGDSHPISVLVPALALLVSRSQRIR